MEATLPRESVLSGDQGWQTLVQWTAHAKWANRGKLSKWHLCFMAINIMVNNSLKDFQTNHICWRKKTHSGREPFWINHLRGCAEARSAKEDLPTSFRFSKVLCQLPPQACLHLHPLACIVSQGSARCREQPDVLTEFKCFVLLRYALITLHQ